MDINTARENIDKIDEKLVKLIVERMKFAKDIAKYKQENNLPIYNKSRERDIMQRVLDNSSEELQGYMSVIYSSLFDVSRAYQSRILTPPNHLKEEIEHAVCNTAKVFPTRAIVACQGIEGSYSQSACDKLFSTPNIMYFNHFSGVFKAVENGLCQYGILPIENSTAGSVNEVYDLMKKNKFFITRSIKMKIDHNLITKKGVAITDIKEVISHEQAINQCSEFLKSLDVKITVCENTAVAAKMLAQSDRLDAAAISSRDCADIFGLAVLSDDIMNSDNNYTRFICISKNLEIYPGADKMSLMLALPHRPGSLGGILSRISSLGLNIAKLESRPIAGKNFEFMFYFDIDANVLQSGVVQLICELCNELEHFTYLGSYSEVF